MQIQINQDQKEMKEHGNFPFPVLVSDEILSRYESGSFMWHWHPEIEFTLVVSGEMLYRINQADFHLKSGQALFGNANTLHTGHMLHGQDCHYISLTFDPKLIYGYEKSLLHTKYVAPLLQNPKLSSICFDLQEAWHHDVIDALVRIHHLSRQKEDFFEMQIQVILHQLWLIILQHYSDLLNDDNFINEKNLDRLKTILSFILENYADKISLEDIAGSIHLCKSECCRLFKKHMHESLFDYLLRYRIEKSLPHLMNPDCSITEAAFQVGFADSNYYSKVFRKFMGCTPTTYRSRNGERC